MVDVMIRVYLGEASHVREFDISILLNPGVHDTTTIVRANTFGEQLCHAVPVAGCVVRPKSVRRLGLPRFPAAALDD